MVQAGLGDPARGSAEHSESSCLGTVAGNAFDACLSLELEQDSMEEWDLEYSQY